MAACDIAIGCGGLLMLVILVLLASVNCLLNGLFCNRCVDAYNVRGHSVYLREPGERLVLRRGEIVLWEIGQ